MRMGSQLAARVGVVAFVLAGIVPVRAEDGA